MSQHFAQQVSAAQSTPGPYQPPSSAMPAKTNMSFAAWSLFGIWPLALIAMLFASSAKQSFLAGDKAKGHQQAQTAKRIAIASWVLGALLLLVLMSM